MIILNTDNTHTITDASKTAPTSDLVKTRPLPQECALTNEATVSVLIVNFNSGAWLSRCVTALLASNKPLEILIGDNGSSDDSLAQLSGLSNSSHSLRVFSFGRNLGFAKAVNRLLGEASGTHLLLLNPDCLVQPDTVHQMLAEMMQRPDCGMAGCLIRNMDGSEQRGCRREIPTLRSALMRSLPEFLRRRIAKRQPGTTAKEMRSFDLAGTPLPVAACDVEAISGAFMLLSREALKKVGAMDEAYFLHCEDLDWCLRFSQAGYRILFVPSVEILHKQGACSEARPLRVEWHKHAGMLYFYRKFYGANTGFFFNAMLNSAIRIRFVLVCGVILLQRLHH